MRALLKQKLKLAFLLLGLLLIFVPKVSLAQNPVNKTKKIIYRKFTSLDFSAQTVQGKVRAPEIFYIFQRKKSQGHDVVIPLDSLYFHSDLSFEGLRKGLKP